MPAVGLHSRYIYPRFSNPTVAMFEERLAALEGAPICRATASGMSAVFASPPAMLRTNN